MQDSVSVEINGQILELLPQRAIYWKNSRTLLVSDLHLGKSGHFRKSGVPAPSGINKKNITRLDALLKKYRPHRLLLLGDLFHSDANREWLDFEHFAQKWTSVEMILIRGNHDLLHSSFYDKAGVLCKDFLEETGFIFLHDADDNPSNNKNLITVSGHIHPGITLRGKGRQSLRLPCFLISNQRIILPAFGEFTGLHIIKPKPGEQIYAVAEGKIVPL
jgi:DNA ligase-associated metallophosphoesterase